MLGRHVKEVAHPEDLPITVAALWRLVATGVYRDGELRLRQAHEDLERRVKKITRELNEALRALRDEMGKRQTSQAPRQELLRRQVTAQEDELAHVSRE